MIASSEDGHDDQVGLDVDDHREIVTLAVPSAVDAPRGAVPLVGRRRRRDERVPDVVKSGARSSMRHRGVPSLAGPNTLA